MTPLGRKVHEKTLVITEAGSLTAVFRATAEENYFGIKGGYAKAVLRCILRQQGKYVGDEQSGKMDLDIVLTFTGSRAKNIEMLSKRVTAISEMFSEINTLVCPEDVEVIKGNLNNPKVIQNFMECRDMTLNEVILVPQGDNIWKLYWTDKCQRDTIQKVGILSANGKGTVRIDSGRMIAAPAGITRLLRFLIERKVERIYLPDWWIRLNNREAKRLKKENLGVYGLILGQRYLNSSELQKRMMIILNKLGITDIKSFEQYMTEQRTFFKLWTGNDFELNPNRSFEEIQKHLSEKNENGENARKEYRDAREDCDHEVITTTCTHCSKNCIIKKCKKCTTFEVFYRDSSEPLLPRSLLCNYNFREAKFYWDKEGFF